MSYISSSYGTWNLSVQHEARQNPDWMLQVMSVESSYDVDSVLKNNVSVQISSPISPAPIFFEANVTVTSTSSEYLVALKSQEVQGNISKPMNSDQCHANVSIQHIPLQMNCSLVANMSDPAKTIYEVNPCNFSHPYLTNSKVVELEAFGDYESVLNNTISAVLKNSTSNKQIATIDSGISGVELIVILIHCGPNDTQNTSCHFDFLRDHNIINYSARFNSSKLNHTAEVNVTGILGKYVSDIHVDINSTTSLNVSPTVKWSAIQSNNLGSQYQFDAVVKNNKVELVRFEGNSSRPSLVKKPSAIYFQYISNETVYLDLHLGASVGEKLKIESRMYRGLNLPNLVTFVESKNTTNSYLEMYYFQYTECLKNMTVSVKNLYDRRQIEQRSLIKMETKAKSNIWPVKCSVEWQEIFSQLFPISPITPICSGDMEVDISYDLYNNSQVQVKLYQENDTLLRVVYQLQNGVHNLSAVCRNDENPTCRVLLLLGSHNLTINSTITTELLHHSSNLSLILRPPVGNKLKPQLELDMVSNNTIDPLSNRIDLISIVKYSDQQSWYVFLQMNSSQLPENIVLIKNGTIIKIQMIGKSVLWLSKRRDWNITYTKESSGHELRADVQFDIESQFLFFYYHGQNKNGSLIYHPGMQINALIEGFLYNYTNCDEHAVLEWITVHSQKEQKHLLSQSMADINMWPLKSTNYINLPIISSCYYCLGDLQFLTIYNSTTDNELHVKVTLDQASLLQVNYTAGKKPQTSEYYFYGTIELAQNRLVLSSPHLLLSTNLTASSNELVVVNVSLLTEGFSSYNYLMKQNLKFASNQNMTYLFVVNSKSLSMSFDLQKENQTTQLAIK